MSSASHENSLETQNRTVAATNFYNEAHVLLLSWQDADSRFHNELHKLKAVFQDHYNYEEGNSTIEEFQIPSERSKDTLDEKLTQFLGNEGSRSLLIIYYGGHGALNSVRRAVWRKLENDGPEVPWHDLQSKLFERQSDILLLIDCCAAAGASTVPGTKGLVEGLFAAGFEAPTPVWGPHSFTANLVAELKKVYDSGTLVYDLHRNLCNTLQGYRPHNRERRAMPHHQWLAPWNMTNPRSIHLQSSRRFSTAPLQIRNAAWTQAPSIERASSFDIVKLQEKFKEMHHWLEPLDQSKFHNATVEAQETGTGQWIWQNHMFKEWKLGKKSFLALYGPAGCGKTVLCASIVKHMETFCRSQDSSIQTHLTAKFYFSFESFSRRYNLESLLKSIIQQLSFAPEISSELRSLYEENRKTWPASSPSILSLQNLLIDGLRCRCSNESTPRRVFILIDALDEIPKGSQRNKVVKFLQGLVVENIPFLSILVTSRPRSDIISRLSGLTASWSALTVDRSAVQSDIGIYVDHSLDVDFEPPLPEETKEKVKERLTRDQDGMFRWAKLQVEALKRLEPASPETIESALAVLPPDLDASYLRILKEIHPSYQQQARNALTWLCFASRPLFIEEVVEICATFPGETPGFQESRRLQPQEYVEQILKDLIVIDPPLDGSSPSPSRNVVRLGHFSVKEYLTGSDILKSEARIFKVATDADKFISQCCLIYLFHNNTYQKKNLFYWLRDYAWNQWAWHGVEMTPTGFSTRSERALRLFDSCVYERDPTSGFTTLREFGLLDWVDQNSSRDMSTLQAAIRQPYFDEDFQLRLSEYQSNEEQSSLDKASTPISVEASSIKHRPLYGGSEIRLVKILPSKYDSPEIKCQLVHVDLDDMPRYDAISYTWNYREKRSSYIRLDGQAFPVRGKIASILRSLRSTNYNTTVTVWIDVLCIDSEHLTEKSVQVSLMPRIYRQAGEVVVILEGEEVVSATFTILEELYTLLDDNDISNSNLDGIRRVVSGYSSGATWNILLKLFSQKWWGRMWLMQEFLLASKATIIYGKTRVKFDKLQRLMVKERKARDILLEVYKYRELNPVMAFPEESAIWERARAVGQLRMVLQEHGRIELPHLLYNTRLSRVTYIPDRIFSIFPLSLIGRESTAIQTDMVVDYNLSAEEVFTNCSRYLLRLYRNLDSFSYISHRYVDQTYQLPSWASTFLSSAPVLDDESPISRQLRTMDSCWQNPCLHLKPLVKGNFQPLEGDDLYSACGTTTIATLTFNLPYLTIERGILVDRISRVQNLHSSQNCFDPDVRFGSLRSPEDSNAQRGKPWRIQALITAMKFYGGISKTRDTEDFWRTIVADQWVLGTRNSPQMSEFIVRTGMGQFVNYEIPPGYIAPRGLEFADGRSMFVSRRNYLGLGPADACEGDYIIVLPGGKVPYILRADHYTTTQEDTLAEYPAPIPPLLRLIGECYVNGIMDGEIMHAAERGEFKFQDVTIF